MNNDVRKLTDGAMMVAIVGVVLLINRQLGGLFEEMFLFLFPIPMVFYSAKYGWKDSIIVLAAMCLLGFMLGSFVTLFYVGSESLIGMIYGNGIYTRQNTHKLVLITMAVGAVVNVLSTVVFAAFFGYDIAAETAEIESVMNNAFAQAGATIPATINFSQYIRTIFVITAILTGVMQGFVTHVLSRLLLKRMRFNIEPATPVSEYFPPKWSGYLGFLGFCAYYYTVMRPFPNELVQNAVQGAGMCGFLYLLIYGYIGIIVAMRIHNPRMRGIGMILALLAMFIMPVALVIFGFLYITTDFHARMLEGANYAKENK